jgi:hypothetical protein
MNSHVRFRVPIRPAHGAVALAFALAATLFAVMPHVAAAQVLSRSVEMSGSAANSTNVTYHVSFNAATTGNVQGIVVDFCDNDPLIGDSCTTPGGFTVGTPTSANLAGTNPTTGWTASQLNTGRTFMFTNGGAGSVTSGTTVSFDVTSVTNPNSTNHSFYARILTYATSGGATGYVAGTEGSFVDDGGIALSTAAPLDVTARVEEQLSFCVYNTTCGDSPAISLGHGPNDILDSTAVDTNTDDFSVSTNAQAGVSVRMKGGTLKSGSDTIPAVGGAPTTITAGTAAYGMYISTAGIGMTAATNYGGGTGGQFGFNGTNTTSTFGDAVATSGGALNNSISIMTFGATASNTTPAGIYTAAEQLIATGTF